MRPDDVFPSRKDFLRVMAAAALAPVELGAEAVVVRHWR